MTILKNIISEMLLLESVSVDEINSAIDNHERIIINYHSNGEDVATGSRVVEVYAYGLTKAGNPVIRGFQPYGDTTTKVPNWKFFRLDRISSWKPTGQKFNHPADDYYKNLGNFNPNGDDSMSVVYKIAKFGQDSENIKTPDKGPKTNNTSQTTDTEPFKTDTERRMERLRQQLDNPITLDDLKTQNGFKNLSQTPTATNGPKTNNTSQDNNNTNTVNKNRDIEDLRQKLGDTSNPISYNDLRQKLSQPDTEPFKTDTERRMERLRQQLDNPTKIDLNNIPKR